MRFIRIVKKLGKYLFLGVVSYFLLVVFLLLVFRWVPVPTSSFMVQHNISAWWNADQKDPVRYEWVAWDELPKSVALAVIASEDQKFPHHYGLDFQAIGMAWTEPSSNRRGASTITQQTVKNLFLWSGRSYLRKGMEASISLLMELIWSKQRILEVYLNIAQFGKRDYGVKAACDNLLKQELGSVNKTTASLLASVLPAPAHYKVKQSSPSLRKKQRWIRKQMRQLGGLEYLDQL